LGTAFRGRSGGVDAGVGTIRKFPIKKRQFFTLRPEL
jgi:hypothetical protein